MADAEDLGSEFLSAAMRAPRIVAGKQSSAYCLDTLALWGEEKRDWSESSIDLMSDYQTSEAGPLKVLPRAVSFYCLSDLREYELYRRHWDSHQGVGESDTSKEELGSY